MDSITVHRVSMLNAKNSKTSSPSTPRSIPRSAPRSGTSSNVLAKTPSSHSRELKEDHSKSSLKRKLFGARAQKLAGASNEASPTERLEHSTTTPSTSLMSSFTSPFLSVFRTPGTSSDKSRLSISSTPSCEDESEVSALLTPTVPKKYTRIAPESSIVRPRNVKHEARSCGLSLTEEEQMLAEHELFTNPSMTAITLGTDSARASISSSVKSTIGAYVVQTCHKVAVNSSDGTIDSIQQWKTWLAAYVMSQYNTSKIPVQPVSGPDFAYLPGLLRSDEAMRLARTSEQCDFTLNRRREKRASRICNELIDQFDTEMCAISRFDLHNEIVLAEVGWRNVGPIIRWTSIATHALMSTQTMIILDASKDWRFTKNPHVTGLPSVSFYAGAPIITAAGDIVGVVSISSTKAKEEFTFQDEKLLRSFADTAMLQLFSREDIPDSGASSPVLQRDGEEFFRSPSPSPVRKELLVPRHRHRFSGFSAFDPNLIPPALNIRKTSQGVEIPAEVPLRERDRFVNVNRQSWTNLASKLESTTPPSSSEGLSASEDVLNASLFTTGRPLPDIAEYRTISDSTVKVEDQQRFSNDTLEDVFTELNTLHQRRHVPNVREFRYSGKSWLDRQDGNSSNASTNDESALLVDRKAECETKVASESGDASAMSTVSKTTSAEFDDDVPLLQRDQSWTNFNTASGRFETIYEGEVVEEAMTCGSSSSNIRDSATSQPESSSFDAELERLAAARNSVASTVSSTTTSDLSMLESTLSRGAEMSFASELWAKWLKCDVIYVISLAPVREGLYRGELEIPGNMIIDVLHSFGSEKMVNVKILLDVLTHGTGLYDNWHGAGDYGCGYMARIDGGHNDDKGVLFCAFRNIKEDGTRPPRWSTKEAEVFDRAANCLRTTMRPAVMRRNVEPIVARQTSIGVPPSERKLPPTPYERALSGTRTRNRKVSFDLPEQEGSPSEPSLGSV